jgi:hypothetical protein
MIDPVTALAVSMNASPGVYALLLGSGVSKAAGIPTGWEIVQDLTGRLAVAEGEDVGGDAIGWYVSRYEREPDYDVLLEELAPLPSERNRLLRAYFEPSEEEREQGLKQPTEAHRAVAELVRRGYVRIVITTNFDRLLERALDEAGVSATVVSSGDDVDGLLPLDHSSCTIVKVHGDYLDTRIKNTERELRTYDPRIDSLLDRVFDDYGLIVCGWSAKYDKALRAAIARCPSRRFSTHWAARGKLGVSAERLATARDGHIVAIESADSFFAELLERVTALADAEEDPMSARVAVARLKRYLPVPDARIRLHDLVSQGTEDLRGRLTSKEFPLSSPPPTPEAVLQRMKAFDAASDIVARLAAVGAFHGRPEQEEVWVRMLQRVAELDEVEGQRLVVWDSLRLYPALVLMYAAGIAAVASGHFSVLESLAQRVRIDDEALVRKLYTWSVLDDRLAKQIPGLERRHTPVSDHLYAALRDAMRDILPSDQEYAAAFDRFEYLWALMHVDATLGTDHWHDGWGPVGRFGWRRRPSGEREPAVVGRELERQGEAWPPLAAGLFGGSLDRLNEVKTAFDAFVSKLGMAF